MLVSICVHTHTQIINFKAINSFTALFSLKGKIYNLAILIVAMKRNMIYYLFSFDCSLLQVFQVSLWSSERGNKRLKYGFFLPVF